MPEIDISKQRSSLNWAQILSIVASVAIAVWIAAGIYWRFEQLERDNAVQKERFNQITNTNIQDIKALEDRVNSLEVNHAIE